MQLLSGEAATQLCKQCAITTSSSSLVDMGCCAVNMVLGAAYKTVHQAWGAFHPQDLCIQFSVEETFQCNPKERKHSHHPDHTHTYTPQRQRGASQKWLTALILAVHSLLSWGRPCHSHSCNPAPLSRANRLWHKSPLHLSCLAVGHVWLSVVPQVLL